MRDWRALAIVPLAAMLLTGPALAQDDADVEVVASRHVVPPADCMAEPRAYEDISTILALEGEGVPPPPTIQISPPLGAIADEETTSEVRAVARRVIACFNAGDVPRATALMTDAGVRRVYWGLTIDEENRELSRTRLASAPEPRADEALVSLIAVTDVLVLPDERVAAFVIIDEPLLQPEGAETLLFVFANQDGMWRMDDLIDFTIAPIGGSVDATPAP